MQVVNFLSALAIPATIIIIIFYGINIWKMKMII